MSYSVSNLFKAIAANNKVPEGQLDNPDIPSFSQAGGVDTQFIRDKAYNSMRLSSAPRNGDGFLLPRSTLSSNPRHDSFLMEGAIDPNVIRQRVNPISEAAPVTHEDALYGIDYTMTTSTDSVGLVQKARSSLYNYKNRFNALASAMPPSDKYANPIASDNIMSKPYIGVGNPIASDKSIPASATTGKSPFATGSRGQPQTIDVLAGVKKGSGIPSDGSI